MKPATTPQNKVPTGNAAVKGEAKLSPRFHKRHPQSPEKAGGRSGSETGDQKKNKKRKNLEHKKKGKKRKISKPF